MHVHDDSLWDRPALQLLYWIRVLDMSPDVSTSINFSISVSIVSIRSWNTEDI